MNPIIITAKMIEDCFMTLLQLDSDSLELTEQTVADTGGHDTNQIAGKQNEYESNDTDSEDTHLDCLLNCEQNHIPQSSRND